MTEPTKILGIFQGDIIVRSAISEALHRLRSHPDLLHTVFESLAQDDLTLQRYGEAEIDVARKWFMETDVPVFLSVRNADLAATCITISLQESVEAEQTHGDVNYEVQEPTVGNWPALTKPFTPTSYSPSSGLMQLPPEVCADLVVAAGMYIVTRTGSKYQLVDYLDDGLIQIKPNVVDDFTGSVLKPVQCKYVTTIESVNFKETYEIGVHAQGEPINVLVLHAIVKFMLLRYKEELLEARNFERTVLASSDLRRNMEFDNELVFDRYISMTGYCRQWWPKKKSEAIQVVNSGFIVEPPVFVNENDPAVTEDGSPPTSDTSWSVKV